MLGTPSPAAMECGVADDDDVATLGHDTQQNSPPAGESSLRNADSSSGSTSGRRPKRPATTSPRLRTQEELVFVHTLADSTLFQDPPRPKRRASLSTAPARPRKNASSSLALVGTLVPPRRNQLGLSESRLHKSRPAHRWAAPLAALPSEARETFVPPSLRSAVSSSHGSPTSVHATSPASTPLVFAPLSYPDPPEFDLPAGRRSSAPQALATSAKLKGDHSQLIKVIPPLNHHVSQHPAPFSLYLPQHIQHYSLVSPTHYPSYPAPNTSAHPPPSPFVTSSNDSRPSTASTGIATDLTDADGHIPSRMAPCLPSPVLVRPGMPPYARSTAPNRPATFPGCSSSSRTPGLHSTSIHASKPFWV